MDHKYLSYAGLKRFFYTKILRLINLKIDKTNGDISNTKVRSLDTISTEFPDPVAGESTKTFLGKVKKSLADWKAIKSTLLTLSMLTNQYENSTSKIPTSALVYALKQNTDELNSNLASGIIQIGGIKYQMGLTSFLVPTQTSATVFDVSDKIPANASIAYCMQQNSTNTPVVIGTFRASSNKWTILTDVANTGNFSVRVFYLLPQ